MSEPPQPVRDPLMKPLFEPRPRGDGAYEEMWDERGEMRAHWRDFADIMRALGPEEISRRNDSVARRLREAGVYFRSYDRNQEQPWPLSAVPVLIDADEWRAIEAGLVQRANLIEATLADIYGAQNLVRDGALPASLIAGSPDFLRPMVGARPRGGRFLHVYAADLGRGPDGRWWVLRDRTQAPSGAGYALGNRIALSRTLPETMRDLGVARLADFFRNWREALQTHASADSAGVALMTPGAYNDTYYEHAYLARYLGFLLVEGEDLVVRDRDVFLRTISGLKKIDVLLRRLDADFVDPLEFNFQSRLGAPGLADATRAGKLTFANALGSGLAESRALMAFWPMLAQRLLGEDLALPNIATWWCGDEAARAHVLSNLDALTLAPAFAGGDNVPAPRSDLVRRLAARGLDYVGQENITLSATPVWDGDSFVSRPFQMRVFLAATEDGWRAMPGGLCSIAPESDPRAMSLQRGGMAADLWVLGGDEPGAVFTLLPGAQDVRRANDMLTTRVADNLYWLGRYLERADVTLRLVRATAVRANERDSDVAQIARRMADLMRFWGVAPLDGPREPARIAAFALRDLESHGAPAMLLRRALDAGSAARERLSPDAWLTLNQLARLARPDLERGDDLDRVDRALNRLAAFNGYAQENMARGPGWAAFEIGRRIERGLAITRIVRALALPETTPASLDALVEMADSHGAHAQRYFVAHSLAAAADLLIFDEGNPRACAYQARRLRELADYLPAQTAPDGASRLRNAIVLFDAAIAAGDPRQVDAAFFASIDTALLRVADAFSSTYLSDLG